MSETNEDQAEHVADEVRSEHGHTWRNVTGSRWRECGCGVREKRPADEQGVPLDWNHNDARVYGQWLLHSFNPVRVLHRFNPVRESEARDE